MRKSSVRELHEHTGALVSAAAEGQIIVIHKRGDRDDFFAKFPQVKTDSGRFLEEDRS